MTTTVVIGCLLIGRAFSNECSLERAMQLCCAPLACLLEGRAPVRLSLAVQSVTVARCFLFPRRRRQYAYVRAAAARSANMPDSAHMRERPQERVASEWQLLRRRRRFNCAPLLRRNISADWTDWRADTGARLPRFCRHARPQAGAAAVVVVSCYRRRRRHICGYTGAGRAGSR